MVDTSNAIMCDCSHCEICGNTVIAARAKQNSVWHRCSCGNIWGHCTRKWADSYMRGDNTPPVLAAMFKGRGIYVDNRDHASVIWEQGI